MSHKPIKTKLRRRCCEMGMAKIICPNRKRCKSFIIRVRNNSRLRRSFGKFKYPNKPVWEIEIRDKSIIWTKSQ